MKKLLALFLALSMVFALCACGASETPAADSADDAWLQAMLAQWEGGSVQSLTAALMDAAARRSGRADDASLIALRLPPLPAASAKEG